MESVFRLWHRSERLNLNLVRDDLPLGATYGAVNNFLLSRLLAIRLQLRNLDS